MRQEERNCYPELKGKKKPTYQFISGNSSAVHVNKISEQTLILYPFKSIAKFANVDLIKNYFANASYNSN